MLKLVEKLTQFLLRNEKCAGPQHEPIQILSLNEKESHQSPHRRLRGSGKATKKENYLPNPDNRKPSSVSTTTSHNSSTVTGSSRRKNYEIDRKGKSKRRTFFKKRTQSKQKKDQGNYLKELSSKRILGK